MPTVPAGPTAVAAWRGLPNGSKRGRCCANHWTTLAVEVDEDEAGNLWAVLRGDRPDMLVVGSHLDSVPKGGWLDGALGVMAGLELLRTVAADGIPPITIALVDWADEEGARFSRSLFGSAASVGTLDIDVLRGLTDKDGNMLPDVLAAHGVDIDNLDGARTRMADVKAYVEVHIEQGPVLEAMGLGICTVTGTKGIERERLVFRGQAAHAGTMPMEMRRGQLPRRSRASHSRSPRSASRHDGVTTVGVRPVLARVSVTAVAGETRLAPWTCATSMPSASQSMFDEAHDRCRTRRRRGGGLHRRVGAHLPDPADAVPSRALLDAARQSVRRGRRPRRRVAERCAARCQRGWPARCRQ